LARNSAFNWRWLIAAALWLIVTGALCLAVGQQDPHFWQLDNIARALLASGAPTPEATSAPLPLVALSPIPPFTRLDPSRGMYSLSDPALQTALAQPPPRAIPTPPPDPAKAGTGTALTVVTAETRAVAMATRDAVSNHITLRALAAGERFDGAAVGPLLPPTIPYQLRAITVTNPITWLAAGETVSLLVTPSRPGGGALTSGHCPSCLEDVVIAQVAPVGPDGAQALLVAVPVDAAHKQREALLPLLDTPGVTVRPIALITSSACLPPPRPPVASGECVRSTR